MADPFIEGVVLLLRRRGLPIDRNVDTAEGLYSALENLPGRDGAKKPAAKPRELSTAVSRPRTLPNGLTPADSQFLAHRAARVSRGGRERGR